MSPGESTGPSSHRKNTPDDSVRLLRSSSLLSEPQHTSEYADAATGVRTGGDPGDHVGQALRNTDAQTKGQRG